MKLKNINIRYTSGSLIEVLNLGIVESKAKKVVQQLNTIFAASGANAVAVVADSECDKEMKQ